MEGVNLLFVALDQILLHFLGFNFVESRVLVEFDVLNVMIELPQSILVTLSPGLLNINRMFQELNSASPMSLGLNQFLIM